MFFHNRSLNNIKLAAGSWIGYCARLSEKFHWKILCPFCPGELKKQLCAHFKPNCVYRFFKVLIFVKAKGNVRVPFYKCVNHGARSKRIAFQFDTVLGNRLCRILVVATEV